MRRVPVFLGADPESRHNKFNDIAGARVGRHDDRMFLLSGFLEGRELAVEQRRRHEMSMPQGTSARDQLALALEIDDTYVLSTADQDIAICAFERRTSDHAMAARVSRSFDPGGNSLQPRPSVFVRERLPGMHLFDVASRMEPVGVLVGPT